jgi:hypothetical protein
MPDDKKYTTKEKIDWLKEHIRQVRFEAMKTNFRDTLPLKSLITALIALQESAAMNGESPEPLSCEGCTFLGRGYSACDKCCRGKKDFLGNARRNANKETE